MSLSGSKYLRIGWNIARRRMTPAGGVIPNTEALDGFFAALVCCTDLAMPGGFLPVLQSGETEAFDLVLRNEAEAQEFIALVMRHSSNLNAQLTSGEVYFLLMIENTAGSIIGND